MHGCAGDQLSSTQRQGLDNHVLPPRFVKIRHYGLLATGKAIERWQLAYNLLEPRAAQLVDDDPEMPADAGDDTPSVLLTVTAAVRCCPRCGQMTIVRQPLPDSSHSTISTGVETTRASSHRPFDIMSPASCFVSSNRLFCPTIMQAGSSWAAVGAITMATATACVHTNAGTINAQGYQHRIYQLSVRVLPDGQLMSPSWRLDNYTWGKSASTQEPYLRAKDGPEYTSHYLIDLNGDGDYGWTGKPRATTFASRIRVTEV
jgi:hypothetical protein